MYAILNREKMEVNNFYARRRHAAKFFLAVRAKFFKARLRKRQKA
jgi:hypothetical protein